MITNRTYNVTQIEEPPIARFLFADTRMAWLWLIVRLYVGYEWLTAGWEKMFGFSIAFGSFGQAVQGGRWIFGAHDGAAIKGFVMGALAKTGGPHPAVQGWYAWFLQHVVLPYSAPWAYLITFGEVLVGIGLILGIFTGIAAFFGAVMNANYLLAGTVSTNPALLILAVFLVLAWRIAGYLGGDYFVLPALGTPWRPGMLVQREQDGYTPMRTPTGAATQ
jgi:thiosulfate dehydrogenase [quinone] large subunit